MLVDDKSSLSKIHVKVKDLECRKVQNALLFNVSFYSNEKRNRSVKLLCTTEQEDKNIRVFSIRQTLP